MSMPTSPSLRAALDAQEQALADSLRALGDSEPSPALDARIRAEARAALRKRPLAAWGASLAAVLALGVGIKVSLAPTELTAPTVPTEYTPTEQAAEKTQSAPAEARPASAPLDDVAGAKPANSGAIEDSPSAPSARPEGTLMATPPAKSSAPERKVASDAKLDVPSDELSRRASAADAPMVAPVTTTSPPSTTAVPREQAPSPLPQPFPAAPPVAELSTQSAPAEPQMVPPTRPASVIIAPAAQPLGADRREQPMPMPTEAPASANAGKRDREEAAFARDGALKQASEQELDTRSKAQSFAPTPDAPPIPAAATAADADAIGGSNLPPQGMAAELTLAQLIQRARRAHAAGDADALRVTLLKINQTYPGIALPRDVQALLDHELNHP